MNFINKFFIKLFSQKVGSDEFGNEYFENKRGKRFVVYRGLVEPSKIPAEWHGWMHYYSNTLPTSTNAQKFSWQKVHIPNLTGTKNAYSPNISNTLTKKTSAGYQAWNPLNSEK